MVLIHTESSATISLACNPLPLVSASLLSIASTVVDMAEQDVTRDFSAASHVVALLCGPSRSSCTKRGGFWGEFFADRIPFSGVRISWAHPSRKSGFS